MSETMKQGQGPSSTEQRGEAGGVGLHDIGGQIRDAVREQYQRGRDKARQWEEGVENYVQEKPLRSLLIAAGVGLLAGLLWRRR
jgi:ElaB/YqjD/DUF883 family membrane-anchored ribosome-binding protein